MAAPKNSFDILVSLYEEFREIIKPTVEDGTPDFTPSAMAAPYEAVQELQHRLDRLDGGDWTVGHDRVYACPRTPVLEGEPEFAPVTLPETTSAANRSVLIAHRDFEIMRPTCESVAGFLAAWLAVLVLITAFVWIIA